MAASLAYWIYLMKEIKKLILNIEIKNPTELQIPWDFCRRLVKCWQ